MKLRIAFSLPLYLLFTSPALSADKDTLQGAWVVDSFVAMGRDLGQFKGTPFTIVGDKIKMKLGEKENESSYKTDDTKSPKHIDIVSKSPEGKDTTSLGIYKIEGDKLIICSGGGSVEVNRETGEAIHKQDPRPTEFESKKAVLMVLKRKK